MFAHDRARASASALDGTCPQAHVPDPLAAGAGASACFVVLRAFASGSAALTGVEAISNGVGAFQPPAGPGTRPARCSRWA